MTLRSIDALSPIDGRYRAAADPLRPLLSEAGLIHERIRIEAQWLLHIAATAPLLEGRALPERALARLRELAHDPGPQAAEAVKELEAQINHDVKAVEYFVRRELAAAGAPPAALELVHFGCTSEDINNLAYAQLLVRSRIVLLEAADGLIATLADESHRHAALPMLARTHGQPASPTTLGKEFANYVARLRRARARLAGVRALGKWNGAVGNFNAHVAAVPAIDWPELSASFVRALGLEVNAYTTQIEPHDWIGELCDALAALNVVLIDFARDAWGYISLGYLRQRAVAGEVGSSTMPHKVNPIDFENGEGNLGVANVLLRHFAEKLPVSRWQRDLTDSTVLRNLGVALAHSLIGWRSIARGLARVEPDAARMEADLDDAWEVLGEAVQTVLRAAGVPNGYEQLKSFTRGRPIDAATLAAFIDTLALPAAERSRLQALRPRDYIGLAARLAASI